MSPFAWHDGAHAVSMGGMLNEEALILLATLGASGLLVLGVVELIWPARPKTPARRPRLAPSRFEMDPMESPGPATLMAEEPADDSTTTPLDEAPTLFASPPPR